MTTEIEPAEPAVIVAGECDDPHCRNEVVSSDGRAVFDSLEAMELAARAAGWYVGDGGLACPGHTRHRRGKPVGTRFERDRRDLGLRPAGWWSD